MNDTDGPAPVSLPRAPRRATHLQPAHPERVCWGCDKLCPSDSLACGNGTIRALHPIELFGADWAEWFDRNDKD